MGDIVITPISFDNKVVQKQKKSLMVPCVICLDVDDMPGLCSVPRFCKLYDPREER